MTQAFAHFRVAPVIVLLFLASASAFSQEGIDPALQARAKVGNAEAQYLIGSQYRNGTGIKEDEAQAVYWFKKSAAQGNPKAENSLGYSYEYGIGAERDYALALVWLRKSAAQGNDRAECNLGDMYLNGWGVRQNYEQAVAFYQKSAPQGNTASQVRLGWMYENGLGGVPLDVAKAANWYSKAAENGDTQGKAYLAKILYNGATGVPRDSDRAVKLYKEAADQGDIEAIGFICEQSAGGLRQSGSTASLQPYKQVLTRAAEQGDTRAMFFLAKMALYWCDASYCSNHDDRDLAKVTYFWASVAKVQGSNYDSELSQVFNYSNLLNESDKAQLDGQVREWLGKYMKRQ